MIPDGMAAIIEELRQIQEANERKPGEVDRREVADELGIDIKRASRVLDKMVKDGRYTKRKIIEEQEKWVYKAKED